jgi:hypothetical protein
VESGVVPVLAIGQVMEVHQATITVRPIIIHMIKTTLTKVVIVIIIVVMTHILIVACFILLEIDK